MKVLKSGAPKTWSMEVTCTGAGNKSGARHLGCGALLQVEEPDLFHTYRSCMGREEDWFVTVRCPECGTFTDIEAPFSARKLPFWREWFEKNGLEVPKEG